MTPQRKYHLYMTVFTVTIMYFVVGRFLPWIDAQGIQSVWVAPLVATVGTAGIYTMLSQVLLSLLEHVRWVKRIILGREDLHGTWIGRFFTASGQPIYSVSYFEQDLDRLVVRGYGYREDGRLYATWISDSSTLDSTRAQLVFAYSYELYDNGESGRGVCVFNLERRHSTHRSEVFQGYSADLSNGRRTENREFRIADDLMDMAAALQEARERFGRSPHPTSQP